MTRGEHPRLTCLELRRPSAPNPQLSELETRLDNAQERHGHKARTSGKEARAGPCFYPTTPPPTPRCEHLTSV
jgi:hypothetical protein